MDGKRYGQCSATLRSIGTLLGYHNPSNALQAYKIELVVDAFFDISEAVEYCIHNKKDTKPSMDKLSHLVDYLDD